MAQEEWAPAAQAPAEEAPAPEGPAAVLEAVKKNLPLIVVGLVVLIGAYVYLFVLPKPGTIDLEVLELDVKDKYFSDADVEITDEAGNTVATPILEDGIAVVTGVPSGTDLTITVSPTKAGYAMGRASVTLASGGRSSVTIYVPKAAALELGSIPEQTIGTGCSKTLSVTVTNNGETDFAVELVAEPDDFRKAFWSEESKTVSAGSTESFSFTVTAPQAGESLSGTVRAKYTFAETSFSATLVEPPEMRVDPGEIDIRCSGGACEDVQVTINNYGKSDLTDLKYELSGVTESDVQIVGFENKPVKPNRRTTFFVRGSAGGAGKVGKLKIISGCGEEELPITIKGG